MCFGRFHPLIAAPFGWCPAQGALGLKTCPAELPGEADAGAFKIPISASINNSLRCILMEPWRAGRGKQ